MASESNKRKTSSVIDLDDMRLIWRAVRNNWYITVIAVALSALVANVYIHRLTEIYAAQTQLFIRSNDTYRQEKVISEGSSFNFYNIFEKMSNEIRVIKSYDLIEKAVSKLNLTVSYFIVGRLKTTEVYEGLPFNISVNTVNPNFYELPINVYILDQYKFKLEYEVGDEKNTSIHYFDKPILVNEYNLVVTKTAYFNPMTLPAIKETNYQFILHNKANLVAKYQSSLAVDNDAYTAILKVSVEDELPERGVVFLDTLSQVYIQSTLQSQLRISENTVNYIDAQLKEIIEILSSMEDTMENYKRDKSILNLGREENEYFSQLSQFESQKTQLKLQYGAIEALEKYIIEDKSPEFLPPSFYVNSNDATLQKLVGELYNLQISKTNSLFMAKDGNPSLVEADQKIKRLKNNILFYLSNTKVAINANVSRIDKQINDYIGSIRTIPEKQRVLLNIQRKLKIHEDMYLFLLQQRANTVIARASIIPETKVIESARSLGMVRPNKSKLLYSFMAFGFIISLVIAFIRIVFFERIESFEELKSITTAPILGEILLSKAAENAYVVVDTDPKSPVTESFRSIRTNMEYMGIDDKSKVVLVTSNSPGEGKTFCSINIAAILAKAGKKVLIIELDLHKPKVNIGLGISSEIGVSSILVGKEEIANTIIKTQIENLDAMLSGPTPANASELVLSKHMEAIIIYGKEHYDYVVVDTPPIGLISDALVLMRFSSINLFVLNTKNATKDSVNHALELIEHNNITNFGFILNGVKRNRSKYYYNKYSYGYGYGYGYGSGSYGYGYGSGSYGYGYGGSKSKDSPSTKS